MDWKTTLYKSNNGYYYGNKDIELKHVFNNLTHSFLDNIKFKLSNNIFLKELLQSIPITTRNKLWRKNIAEFFRVTGDKIDNSSPSPDTRTKTLNKLIQKFEDMCIFHNKVCYQWPWISVSILDDERKELLTLLKTTQSTFLLEVLKELWDKWYKDIKNIDKERNLAI